MDSIIQLVVDKETCKNLHQLTHVICVALGSRFLCTHTDVCSSFIVGRLPGARASLLPFRCDLSKGIAAF